MSHELRIYDAAGETTGFFYVTEPPREASASLDRLVLRGEILEGPFEGRDAAIELRGSFDPLRREGEVEEIRERVSGDTHFAWRLDTPADLAGLLDGEDRPSGDIDFRGNAFANRMLTFDGADRLYGRGGEDTLIAGAGRDGLFGGGGDDRLLGGSGEDDLYGGGGADRFVFRSARDASADDRRDTIVDFAPGADTLDLRLIDADADRIGNQRFDWIGGEAFSGEAGELRYRGRLLTGDSDGDGEADFAIALAGRPDIEASDILL